MTKSALVALAAFALGLPGIAVAGERILLLRTVEDSRFPPDRGFCAAAPFTTTVFLGASVWSYEARSHDGAIMNTSVKRIGTATGCAGVASLANLAPFGSPPKFMLRLNLPDGMYTALGQCTVTSDYAPLANVFLAGCTLEVIDAPAGVRGGIVSSASVFNPYRISGLETGSYWTLRIYTD